VALVRPEDRFWRTDTHKKGRNIYALKTNDVSRPSEDDPLIGVMETTAMAEDIVDTHNKLLERYGRHYRRVLMVDE
jgi:hypothetical protein